MSDINSLKQINITLYYFSSIGSAMSRIGAHNHIIAGGAEVEAGGAGD